MGTKVGIGMELLVKIIIGTKSGYVNGMRWE